MLGNMKLGQLMITMNWIIFWTCGVAANEKWLRLIFYAENVEHMHFSEGVVPAEQVVPVLFAYINLVITLE